MSADRHSTFGKTSRGSLRATPSTDSIRSSCASDASTLVPTFPVAPRTTTRIPAAFPPPPG